MGRTANNAPFAWAAVKASADQMLGDPFKKGDTNESRRRSAAMSHISDFAAIAPAALFVDPAQAGSAAANRHNEWTLCLFANYLHGLISEATGKPYASSTIETYVRTAAHALSISWGFKVLQQDQRLKLTFRGIARDSALPPGSRKRRLGLRRQHLRRAASTMAQSADPNQANLWAATCVAHILMLRGGEIQHLRFCDATYAPQGGRQCILFRVLAIKMKSGMVKARHPILVPEVPGDPACPYAALEHLWGVDTEGRGALTGGGSEAPIFRLEARGTTRPITTNDLRDYLKRVAAAAGFEGSLGEITAHSTRIGGATDFADGGGSLMQVKSRGRWDSDIADIYTRDTVNQQLEAADAMDRANSVSIEELCQDWTQLAR